MVRRRRRAALLVQVMDGDALMRINADSAVSLTGRTVLAVAAKVAGW